MRPKNLAEHIIKSIIVRSRIVDQRLLELAKHVCTVCEKSMYISEPSDDDPYKPDQPRTVDIGFSYSSVFGLRSAKCFKCNAAICSRVGCMVGVLKYGLPSFGGKPSSASFYCSICCPNACHICGIGHFGNPLNNCVVCTKATCDDCMMLCNNERCSSC